ncbi:MAG TPA: flagellar hook-length control protein FliK [Planctomycetota bacterium]|nr:flagellar hook-length control protein FliK [Planctomycetota bacterium]
MDLHPVASAKPDRAPASRDSGRGERRAGFDDLLERTQAEPTRRRPHDSTREVDEREPADDREDDDRKRRVRAHRVAPEATAALALAAVAAADAASAPSASSDSPSPSPAANPANGTASPAPSEPASPPAPAPVDAAPDASTPAAEKTKPSDASPRPDAVDPSKTGEAAAATDESRRRQNAAPNPRREVSRRVMNATPDAPPSTEDASPSRADAGSDVESAFRTSLRSQIDASSTPAPAPKTPTAPEPERPVAAVDAPHAPLPSHTPAPPPLPSSSSAPLPPAAAPPARPDPALPAWAAAESVLRQLRVHLRPGAAEIRLRLDPPGLGELRIRFVYEDRRLRARVEATEPTTAALLREREHDLRAAIKDAGIDVADLDLAADGNGGAPSDARDARAPHSERRPDRAIREAPAAPAPFRSSARAGAVDVVA